MPGHARVAGFEPVDADCGAALWRGKVSAYVLGPATAAVVKGPLPPRAQLAHLGGVEQLRRPQHRPVVRLEGPVGRADRTGHYRTTDLELNRAFPFRQNSLSSAISTTSLNRILASAFMKATLATVALSLS